MALLGSLWLLAGAATAPLLEAQRVSGSASLSADAYQQTGLSAARRPGQSFLASGTLNFALGAGVSLPISFYASSEGTGYQQPFNQFGASPRWSWGTAHAGYFSTQLSELTLQDARLLGGGVELQPGPVRIAVVHGVSQRAFAADTALGRPGLLQQKMSAVQLGIGRQGKARLWFTGLRAEDDLTSLSLPSTPGVGVTPQQNLVGSARFALPIRDKFLVEGEVAGSGYSEDTRADSLTDDDIGYVVPTVVRNLFTPRSSSRFDAAGTATLRITPVPQFGLGFTSRYVGPGYRSLGATQLEVDLLDFTVNPRITTSKVNVNVNVGRRENNVAATRATTTSRTIVDATVLLQPSDRFSIASQFTNYGMRAPNPNDTLVVDNISRMASVTPSLRFSTGRLMHDLQVGYSFQDFADRNLLTGVQADNRTHGLLAAHTVILPNGVSLSTSASDVRGLSGGFESVIRSLTEALGAQMFKRRLALSASGTYTRIETTQLDTGLQATFRATWRIDPKHHQLQASTQYRQFDYGLPRSGSNGYTEMQSRVGYTFSF